MCLILSGITSGLLLLNGFYLYTKIREIDLMNSNNKKILWKKTIDEDKAATRILTISQNNIDNRYDHGDEHQHQQDNYIRVFNELPVKTQQNLAI